MSFILRKASSLFFQSNTVDFKKEAQIAQTGFFITMKMDIQYVEYF